MGKLDGKVAIITGASQGIGKASAKILASAGCDVVLTARTASKLTEAAQEIAAVGVEVEAVPGNVADEQHVESLFDKTRQRFGRLDVLVNNAAVFDGGPIDEMSIDTWDHVISTNLRGPFLCTRAAVRIMKPLGGGRIINIGSIAGLRVRPDTAPYAASKSGLWGLTQVTALEGRGHGITCCCLHPGNTRVERRHDDPGDVEPMMDTLDIAEVVRLMATLPKGTQMLQAVVIPDEQPFVGRG